MRNNQDLLSRRCLMKLAAAGTPLAAVRSARAAGPVSLFDGKTLQGWLQIENNAVSLSAAGITEPGRFAERLSKDTDPLAIYLRGGLQPSVRTDVAAYSPSAANAKAVVSALAKDLNAVINGASIYDRARFAGVKLRPETEYLLARNPTGLALARLNKLLLEDAYPSELARSAPTGWIVKDGAMASTGVGRGVILTANDYSRFRLIFTLRHISGNPDHQPCILIFCTRPQAGDKLLDALRGLQFQAPLGGHWDYRPGKNNDGGAEFKRIVRPQFDNHQWSRVEIVADASKGTARMAVAQPVTSKAIEVLQFNDPAAGKAGPIAWQMHNAGLFDEFKDVTIEADPADDRLITVG